MEILMGNSCGGVKITMKERMQSTKGSLEIMTDRFQLWGTPWSSRASTTKHLQGHESSNAKATPRKLRNNMNILTHFIACRPNSSSR